MGDDLELGSMFDLQRFAEDPANDPKPPEGGNKGGAPAPAAEPPAAEEDPLDLDDDEDNEDKDDGLDDDEREELDRLRGEILTPEEKAKRELERERKKREKAEAQVAKFRNQDLRRTIAEKFKVPERVVVGTTKAEMLKSAKDWSEQVASIRVDIDKQVRQEYEGRLGPIIKPETPKAPDGGADDMDKQIEEASKAGDVSTVTRLVTQKLTRAKAKAAQ